MITVENARKYHGPGEYVGRAHPRFPLLPRGSPLQNPFKIGVHGDPTSCVFQFHQWLIERLKVDDSPQLQELRRLANIHRETGSLTLICWCVPELCHASIIRALVEIELAKPEWFPIRIEEPTL
jgi:hypothetical protein